MKTDMPLKVLMMQHGEDLLPLFGLPYAELIQVETIELPTTQTRLDNVLHIRTPKGQEYLLVVEWQGYPDKSILWRLTSYLAWLAQRYPDKTVIGSVVYLTQASDMGDTLLQWIDGQIVYHCHFSCVQLWKLDAQAALASSSPGLCALSPLMAGVSEELILQALNTILTRVTEPARQKNLLSILTTFAEPWISTEQLLRLVGKERLMESKIWSTLLAEAMDKAMEEKETEFAQRIASLEEEYKAEVEEYKAEVEEYKAKEEEYKAKEEEYKAKEAERAEKLHINELQQTLENALITRFPQAPLKLIRDVRQVTQPSHINDLIVALVIVQDAEEFAHKVQEILHAGKN